jgi:hypothetical protein
MRRGLRSGAGRGKPARRSLAGPRGYVFRNGHLQSVRGLVKKAKKRAAPGNRNSSKHRGDVAEMQFMIEAKNRGFGVSKPFGDNERYDLILDGGRRRLWRVQVKSSASVHHNGFAVRACWRSSRKHLPYTAALIDFMAVVIQSKRVPGRLIWYVIPVRALGGRLTINLYPFGGRRDCELRLERYRDAWWLLGHARRRR